MKKNLFQKGIYLFSLLLFVLVIPLFVHAASANSGLAVAKYKLEGAMSQSWTDLPISTTSANNSFHFSITKPGTTVVTIYAEDKAGNQNYQIKSFTIDNGIPDAPVKEIQYRLTGATEKGWTTYTGPFVITNEGITNLEAKIIDEAGNETTVKEIIRLDKTSPVHVEAVITLE